MVSNVDIVELIASMDKTASSLVQLSGEMKQAAFHVLADRNPLGKDAPPAGSVHKSLESMVSAVGSIDISKLIADIKKAVSDIAKKDISTIQGFKERQLKRIAKYAELTAKGIANGDIREEPAALLEDMKEMAEDFIITLIGLTKVMIEKAINAMLSLLIEAVKKIVPIPSL